MVRVRVGEHWLRFRSMRLAIALGAGLLTGFGHAAHTLADEGAPSAATPASLRLRFDPVTAPAPVDWTQRATAASPAMLAHELTWLNLWISEPALQGGLLAPRPRTLSWRPGNFDADGLGVPDPLIALSAVAGSLVTDGWVIADRPNAWFRRQRHCLRAFYRRGRFSLAWRVEF